MADGVGSREYNRQKREAAADVARRLEYQAEQLLIKGMNPEFRQHKHKWATGKEKWEAVQKAGRIAAGVEGTGRGRRGRSPEEKAVDYLGLVMDLLTDAAVEGPTASIQARKYDLRLGLIEHSSHLSAEDIALISAVINQ